MDNELNSDILRAVNHLIDDSSAKNLNTTLDSLFREYITSFDSGVYPLDYNQVINDYYCLKGFLIRIESATQQKGQKD